MDLNLNLVQSQVLSLKQTLSVTILQLGQSELCDFIEKERLENPALDLESSPLIVSDFTPSVPFTPRSVSPDEDFDFFGELNGEEDCESLTEHIFSQIKLSDLSYQKKMCAATVCGFLEKSGYILSDTDTLCQLSLLSCEEVEGAISFIQTLDPTGVGARSLSECLCLQLEETDDISRKIASDFLPLVANGKLSAIANALKTDLEKIQSAVKRIKALNPKPGLLYGNQSKPIYVLPDIIVTVENSVVSLALSNENIPVLKISSGYSNLLKECKDETAIKYLVEKLEKARWLQQCIENRSKTLLAVACAIVKHQSDFFTLPAGQLRPLKLCDIAKEISMHESTVSRAVKDKYIQCSRGIIPLKQLFSGKSSGSFKEGKLEVSAHTIKEKIQKMIKEENKTCPLSDQRISDVLRSTGIICSRRTVAKYRYALGIPSTNQR